MKKIVFFFSLLILATLPEAVAQVFTEEDATTAINNADSLMRGEKFEEALTELEKVKMCTTLKQSASGREKYYSCQIMTCDCLYSLDLPEMCYMLAKELLKDSLSESEKTEVYVYYTLGGYRHSLNLAISEEFSQAREILNEIHPYADAELSTRISQRTSDFWYSEATNYEMDGQYEKAYAAMEEARKGYSQIGRTNDLIKTIREMGDIKEYLHQFAESISLYQEATQLADKTHDDQNLIKCLQSLITIYSNIGDKEASHPVIQKLDSLIENTNQAEIVFDYYTTQGDEALNRSQNNLAEYYFKKAEEVIARINTPTYQPNKICTKLENLYCREERYEEAIDYAKKMLVCSNLNPNNPARYLTYLHLADLYKTINDSTNAFESCDSSLNIINFSTEPREIYYAYLQRGRTYSYFNRRDVALSDFKYADSILVSAYGKLSGERMYLLPFIGNVENQLGHNSECEKYYREYAELVRHYYGESHSNYIDALYFLAQTEALAGHNEDACADYAQSIEILKQTARTKIPYLSYSEKEKFWSSFSDMLCNITPFTIAVDSLQTKFTRTSYDALLLSKAFLLESERSIGDVISSKGTEEDKADYSSIVSLQSRIKSLERDFAANADSIMILTKKMSTMDMRLKDRCRSLGGIMDFMDIDYFSVKEKLRPDEVLIDFTDYIHKKDGRKYAAYMIRNEQQSPILVPLFSESSIDSMQITKPYQYYDLDYCSDLVDYIWSPLAKYIEEGSTIYYVPSHLLFQIALESIPTKDGSLLGEHYNFVRLSSARELENAREHTILDYNQLNAVLYGGLTYDLKSDVMVKEAKKYNLPPELAMRSVAVSPTRNRGFCDLPGTKKEVETIRKILRRSHVPSIIFMGKRGTEESFMSLNGKGSSILHLATHGFYVNSEDAHQYEYLKGHKDAMLLSGLVMSGGNAAWKGDDTIQGVMSGILTAENIARMDLSGVELVVLSACQTGQGKPTPEGLFGLQRAFKQAGAKTIVMSLWEINDAVTQEFMEIFYSNITCGMDKWNKRKAFEKTKAEIRNKYPYHPDLWAPFIMLD